MLQHGSIFFFRIPPPRFEGLGSKGQNSTLSEYGRVSYQIKGNDAYINMIANILHTDPHPTIRDSQKVKIKLFQTMVMLNIKLNGIRKAAT